MQTNKTRERLIEGLRELATDPMLRGRPLQFQLAYLTGRVAGEDDPELEKAMRSLYQNAPRSF